MQRVLIIDDNPDIAKALEVSLGLHDIETCYAEGPEEGLAAIHGREWTWHQDMNFTRDTTSGKEGCNCSPHPGTGPGSAHHSPDGLDGPRNRSPAGARDAADYLAKPWDEENADGSENLLELRRFNGTRKDHARAHIRSALAQQHDLCGAVHASDAMHHVFSLATQVAAANVPVLITGRTASARMWWRIIRQILCGVTSHS
jgi:DNA-binding NtrC family response regulator